MPTGRVTALQLFGFSCLLYDVALTMLRWWCFVDDFQDWGRVGWDVKRLCILADAGDVALMMSRWGRCLVDNVKGWVGVDCTGHCQRQRQSLESKAAYIHVLLYVPKKIERSLERHWSTLQSQQVKKHLEQSWFWGATSKTSADVGQNACGPPEFIWNELDDTRICSKNCLKPEFCKDCGIATPKKQPGRYAAAYLCLFHMGSLKGSERSPYNSVNNPRFIHIIYQWYSDISLVTKKNVSTFQL